MPTKPTRKKKLSLVLNLTALAIDSNYEPVTSAAFNYRERHVYPYLLAQGLVIKKLQGPLARRHYVASEAKKPEVVYLTGVGHGLHNLYTGDHGDAIFLIGNYHPDEVKGKIVHLLSCQAGRSLGPDFVQNSCLAFFGYDEDFSFTLEEQDIFFECDSEIDKAFADGLTAAQVYDRVVEIFNERIDELWSAGKFYTAGLLEFDRDHLRCPSSGGTNWGDTRAKLA